MTLLYPYPPHPEYAPWAVGENLVERESSAYNFTSYDALVEYFSAILGQEFVLATVENEKQVFVVRRDVSLEETRLQFLKKCANRLAKTWAEIQQGHSRDWGYIPTQGY